MRDKLHVLIVGAGPAGSTLARLLDDQFDITIIDKKRWDGRPGFMKPCGGLLAPGSQKTLKQMGLSIPSSILVYPQQSAVHTFDLNFSIHRKYPKKYINVDRHKFDLWLTSLLPARVHQWDDSIVTKLSRVDEKIEVHWTRQEVHQSALFDLVIGADGANSIVRSTFFQRPIRNYTAIQEWFPLGTTLPHYAAYFDTSLTPSYAWSDTKDGHYIIGAALIPSGAPTAFNKLAAKIKEKYPTCGEVIKREACLINCPRSFKDFAFITNGVALIGEAAGLVTPSSLEGISHALRSGRLLANELNKHGIKGLKKYRFKAPILTLRIAWKSLRIPFMYWPWLRRLVLWSGLLSTKD